MRNPGLDRREFLSLGAGALAATGFSVTQSTTAGAKADRLRPAAQITITEGTNIALAISPDEAQIVFDLYGALWMLPIDGGVARALTDVYVEASLPQFSPDGKALVFQSYRDGNFHIWMLNADGTGLRQVTDGPFDCREPRLSPDGASLAYASDATGEYAIHVRDLATGNSRIWARIPGRQCCQPAWSPDGTRIAFAVDREHIEVMDARGTRSQGAAIQPSTDVMNPAQVQSPAFTPDGEGTVHHVVKDGVAEYHDSQGALFRGEDVFPFAPLWLANGDLLYAADGKIKRRSPAGATTTIAFACTVPLAKPVYVKKRRDYDGFQRRPVVGIGSPTLSPDGTRVLFRALNALYLMTIGRAPEVIVNDGYWVCDPAWSPDGRTIAYSSDRSGKLELWLRELESGTERQLTYFTGAALSAAWSKDGRQIAFLDQNGALYRVEVSTATVKPVFGPLWEPGRPSWSADGKTITYAAFRPYSARYREGLSEILTVDVATGAATYQQVFPAKSLGTRGDDGPVWSQDGKHMLLVFASRLYRVAVTEEGRFVGAPELLNDELTDAPTSSADGVRILYLSGGKLRMLSLLDGATITVPHELTWVYARPSHRVVIRAGRLWQGRGPETRSNVDVIIENGRIADLLPAGHTQVADAKLIDASDATVLPGLVEMHAHRQMQGYGYGDRDGRLWLSLGVTTARSPGSPAYHAIEDREALDAGARVGPRYFCTGEALDGSRIYYNFMRPLTEPDQLALELERAKALSYDMIKFYVRLPVARQKEMIEWAHAHGMHVSGHYHYPVIGFGGDGQEHIGATSRWGYSRSVSLLGYSYQDVTAIFLQAGASITPTLLVSGFYGVDRSLVEDRRTKALYPSWEYAKLVAAADRAIKTDQTVFLRGVQNRVDTLKHLIRNGGRVLSGTDSPIEFNGVSLHMNLRAMVACGLKPYEALLTSTRFCGEFLDQPFGVVAPGMLADLLVTEGNPLVDIRDAAAVRHVVKNGFVFDIDSLVAPFEGKTVPGARAIAAAAVAPAGDAHWWHSAQYVEEGRDACCLDRPCRGQGALSALVHSC